MQKSSKALQDRFRDLGITKFRTPTGRKYEVDYYADMVIRTETMISHNDGNILMLQQNGYDLVRISKHTGSCKECKKYEGKIYSISGANKKYPPLSSIPNGGPPFHPHCKHVVKPCVDL